MFCISCGKEIDDNTKFCKYCGSAVGSATDSVNGDRHDLDVNNKKSKNNGRSSKKNSSIVFLFIVLILMIALVAVLVVVALNGSDKYSNKSSSKSYSKDLDDEDESDGKSDDEEELFDEKKTTKEKNPAELAKDSLEMEVDIAAEAPAAEPAVEEAYPAAAEVAEAAPAEETETLSADELKAELEDCIEAYKNIWDQYNNNGYIEVSLIYVDDDIIPELVLHGDCEASGNIIFTYHDGNVEELYTSRLSFSYVPRENIIDNSDGHMGYYYNLIYSIKNHRFVTLHEGYVSEQISDDGEDFIYDYTWDGSTVSESEYTRNLNELYDATKAISSYGMNKYNTVEAAMADL